VTHSEERRSAIESTGQRRYGEREGGAETDDTGLERR